MANNSSSNGLIFGGIFGLVLQFASSNIASVKFYSDITNGIWNFFQNMSWYPASLHINFGGYIISILAGILLGYYIEKR